MLFTKSYHNLSLFERWSRQDYIPRGKGVQLLNIQLHKPKFRLLFSMRNNGILEVLLCQFRQ